jgi:xylose isomerase
MASHQYNTDQMIKSRSMYYNLVFNLTYADSVEFIGLHKLGLNKAVRVWHMGESASII